MRRRTAASLCVSAAQWCSRVVISWLLDMFCPLCIRDDRVFWGDVRWNAAQFVRIAWGFSGSPAQHSNMTQTLSYTGWTSAKYILLHSGPRSCTLSMALNVPGLVATIIFYLLVLGIGIWASIKSKKDENRTQANHADMALLGNRKISLVVGIFTTTGEFSLSWFVQHCSRCNLQVPSFLWDI